MIPPELAAARLKAAKMRPYLATALFALMPVETKELKTVAVDPQWRLYYDPIIFKSWNSIQLAGALIHEVSHLLRDHAARCQEAGAQAKAWNIAADLEINGSLRQERIELPDNVLYPQTYKLPEGLLAEEYYKKLPPPLNDENNTNPTMGAGNCGSCATGIKQPFEEDVDESKYPGLSSVQIAQTKQDTARRILQASKRGQVSAGWQRWATEQDKPKVNWPNQLNVIVRRSITDVKGMVNYSYSRPSRRQSAFPEILMPGMTSPNPLIAVVIDTSGSITDPLIGQVLKEVQGILKAMSQPELRVVSCDNKVHFNQKIRKLSEVKVLGGGGTDMRVGIQAALEAKPVPQIVIVITDGATPWPTSSPKNTKVVAALLGAYYACDVPSWAKKIIIS